MKKIAFIFAVLMSLFVGPTSAETIQKNIQYSSSGQRLDLCMPDSGGRRTGLVFVHGGGFKSGNRQQMLSFCKLLAKGGFPSVTVSYRLTQQGHAFPAAPNDVSAAVDWMRRNAGKLGIDPNKIVLIGYSAGGTLAMSVGLGKKRGIAGIVSVAGIADLERARTNTPHRQLRKDIDAYLNGKPGLSASPISSVNAGDPPVFLLHGRKDKLVPVEQSVVMAERLKAARVKVLLRVFDQGGHGIMLPGRHLKPLLQDLTKFLVAIDAS